MKKPENEKELKSFLGAIQYLSKHIENFSTQTEILRQLLKKNAWNWIDEHTEAFENLKQKNHENTVFGPLQLKLPEDKNHGPVLRDWAQHYGKNNQTEI